MRADVKIKTKGPSRLPSYVDINGIDLTDYCQKATVEFPAGSPPIVRLMFFAKDIDIEHEPEEEQQYSEAIEHETGGEFS